MSKEVRVLIVRVAAETLSATRYGRETKSTTTRKINRSAIRNQPPVILRAAFLCSQIGPWCGPR